MLFLIYPTITLNYLVLCFIVSLGTLQWSAARNNRLSLSLLGPWGLGRPGIIVGMSLVGAGLVWFLACTPRLFEPGLAGGELSTLFGAGGLGALIVTRLSGAIWKLRK